MSYEKDVKITFYNMEDGEEVSDEYSEFLMINRDGEVFELFHNGRGDYNPSYEGDWVGYKMESRAKADEYEAKAKLMDNIYAELKKRDGEAIDSLNVDYYDFGVYVARTIEEYESECDSNA